MTTFSGSYYQLTEARCEPKPVQRPHPPICIGGSGEKRTLRTAARFAQHWNFVGGTVEQFTRAKDVLHQHCADIGRDPAEILLSSHVAYTGDAAETAASAAELGAAGVAAGHRAPAPAAYGGGAGAAGGRTRRDRLSSLCRLPG